MRGGFGGGMAAPGMAPMGYGHPQQSYPMAAHPQMYAAQQQYGRGGGYPPQPAMNYNAMPQQGKRERTSSPDKPQKRCPAVKFER